MWTSLVVASWVATSSAAAESPPILVALTDCVGVDLEEEGQAVLDRLRVESAPRPVERVDEATLLARASHDLTLLVRVCDEHAEVSRASEAGIHETQAVDLVGLDAALRARTLALVIDTMSKRDAATPPARPSEPPTVQLRDDETLRLGRTPATTQPRGVGSNRHLMLELEATSFLAPWSTLYGVRMGLELQRWRPNVSLALARGRHGGAEVTTGLLTLGLSRTLAQTETVHPLGVDVHGELGATWTFVRIDAEEQDLLSLWLAPSVGAWIRFAWGTRWAGQLSLASGYARGAHVRVDDVRRVTTHGPFVRLSLALRY